MKYKEIIFALSIFVFLISISAISAAEITTDTNPLTNSEIDNSNYYVSVNGSDSNLGSLESPFKTIDKAISVSKSNTTNIYLLEGKFSDKGNVNLTANNNINFIGISSEKTIIDGSNNSWFLNITNGKLTIKNLTLENFYMKINQSGTNKGIISSNSDIFIDNVLIQKNNIEIALGKNEDKSTIYSGVIYSTGNIKLDNVTGKNNRINNTLGTDLASLRKLADWGCLIVSFKSTTIKNSEFYNNFGSRSSVVYGHSLSNLTVDNSIFANNSATYAGGVFLTYLNTTTHISNSIFKDNNGTNAGGVIYQQRYSNLFVDNCEFSGNYANTGGSLYAHHYSNLTAENCTFIKGRAKTGSVILGADDVNLNIKNCNFLNNTAKQGAIMGDEGCKINVDNSVFIANKGIFGSSVMGDMINNITLTNSIFINNTADYGGVVYGNYESIILLKNNTIIGNTANNGSVVFLDNTGTLDEDDEVSPKANITSKFISVNNILINNTSEDNNLFVNYPESKKASIETIEIANNPKVIIGDKTSFTIIVKNTGDYELSEVIINENIPEGLEYSGFIGENWTKEGNKFIYHGILKPNESFSLTINFITKKLGNISNQVTVSTNLTNNINLVNSTMVINKTVPQDKNSTESNSTLMRNSLVSNEINTSIKAGNPILCLLLVLFMIFKVNIKRK